MGRLGEQAAALDEARFVGRQQELATLLHALEGSAQPRLTYVVGGAGIGKSALLREFARRARAAGAAVGTWDRHRFPPVPRAGAGTEPQVLLLDDVDDVPAATLRDQVVGPLSAGTVVVLASRRPPGPPWFDDGWATMLTRLDVPPLPEADAAELLSRWGLDDPTQVDDTVRHCHGLPLALVIAARGGGTVDPELLVQRLLGPDLAPGMLRVLATAALVRVTTPALLAAVAPEAGRKAYAWLAGRSFMEERLDGLVMDPVVADALVRLVARRDPEGEGTLRAQLAHHLHEQVLLGDVEAVQELQHLMLDATAHHGVGDVPADVIELLRMLRVPRLLETGPEWLGATAAERREVLRAWLTSALDAFGTSSDDQLAVRIVREAYLDGMGPHEAIARRLHLSRSAYFRRLGAALERLAADVVPHEDVGHIWY